VARRNPGLSEPADIEEAARRLAAGRLEGRRIAPLPEGLRPRDEYQAYILQDEVHLCLADAGWGSIAGHKIGCTTPVMQAFLDIPNPCAGAVFDRGVRTGDGEFRHADFRHVGVECEIAVRLGRDLARGPWDRASVAKAVAAVMAAIEVVDDRYDDYRRFDTPTLIADDFFNAGCVLGRERRGWRDLDLAALAGRMTIDGVEVGRGVGADIMGHPMTALAWLAGLRAARGTPLRAGAFVLLGSVVDTKWVEAGQSVEVEIDSLGRAGARFD